MKITLSDLKELRAYFGVHDTTMQEHMLYAVADKLVNKFEEVEDRIEELRTELAEAPHNSFAQGQLSGELDSLNWLLDREH
ncbi:hypothetical protein GCM10027347_44410 [Larkinella harenae]